MCTRVYTYVHPYIDIYGYIFAAGTREREAAALEALEASRADAAMGAHTVRDLEARALEVN